MDELDKSVLLKLEQIIIQQNELKQQQYKLNQDMELVLMLLKGNPLDKNDQGLIGRVVDIEDTVEKHEAFKNKGLYVIMTAISLGGGWVVEFIKKVIAK